MTLQTLFPSLRSTYVALTISANSTIYLMTSSQKIFPLSDCKKPVSKNQMPNLCSEILSLHITQPFATRTIGVLNHVTPPEESLSSFRLLFPNTYRKSIDMAADLS